MIRLKPKHEELRRHLTRFIDRARWPDYVVTDDDLRAYIEHESTGRGAKPEPLAWVKQTEEITIHQLWSEMAETWANGMGWYYPIAHTIRCELSERRGSNIWLRKLLTIAKGIRDKGFMTAFLAYSGFSPEDRARYLAIKGY